MQGKDFRLGIGIGCGTSYESTVCDFNAVDVDG